MESGEVKEKKNGKKNSKSIREVFVTLTKKKSRRRQKKAFFASRWEFCGITTGPPHRGTLMKDLVDLFQEFLGVTDPGLLQRHRAEMPLEFGTWIPWGVANPTQKTPIQPSAPPKKPDFHSFFLKKTIGRGEEEAPETWDAPRELFHSSHGSWRRFQNPSPPSPQKKFPWD